LFNLMKGIFGKPAPAPEPEEAVSYEGFAEEAPLETDEPPMFQATAYEEAAAPEAAPAKVDVDSSQMILPLSSIITSFPVELQQRIKTDQVGGAAVAFPLDAIMAQISQGLVRVPFGEIRQAAPSAFTTGADRDLVMVTLPLGELVSRLQPALLGRRAGRKVEVPDDVASPFAGGGQGLTLGKPIDKRTPDTAMLSRPRGAQASTPVPPVADPRARGNVNSVQRPAAPGGTTIFNKKTIPMPTRSVPPLKQAPGTSSLPPGKSPTTQPPIGNAPIRVPLPKPAATPVSGNGSNGGNGAGNGHGNGGHAPKLPEAKPTGGTPIWVSLDQLMKSLPDSLQMEMAQLNLAEAKLALPADLVEAGLMRGKVTFTWRQIRGWIRPTPLETVSAHDALVVSRPLAMIAPLFMGRDKQGEPKQKRVQVDEKIPNLFFGFPQPEATPTEPTKLEVPVVPAPKPAETNYFIWDDDKEVARVEGEGKPVPFKPAESTPGTTFASRKATPNDVVMKASLLEGVYGALVALPDGLLVASKLSPEVNGETIAALIPQMYSKLSGCTKELRMGELNNLNFTVGNVPWKIFRVNGIFFAAFGCAGEPLPSAHLAELAAELDYRKTQ